MRLKLIACFPSLMLVVFLMTPATTVFSFNDEIGAPKEEVWQAVLDALASPGLAKSDQSAGTFVTKWVEDEVRRSRGLFRGFVHKRVRRRYRFHGEVKKGELATALLLRVQAQEKTAATNPSIPWKRSKLDSEDYILEQEYFYKILHQLEANKRAAASTNHTLVSTAL